MGYLLGSSLQVGVPFGSEHLGEGFLEETIDGGGEAVAFLHGIAADGPAVVVETVEGLAVDIEFLYSDGVEGAGDGLPHAVLAQAHGAFNGTEAVAVVVIGGEDAVLAVDDGGDQVALLIDVGYALLVDDLAGLGREVTLNEGKDVFDGGHLIHGYRGTGVALHTADAAACLIVAAEHLIEDVN